MKDQNDSDPIYELGKHPVADDITDASESHDRYLYGHGGHTMKTLNAVVATSKSLELAEEVSLPTGTHVRINILEADMEDDYAKRLDEYYRNCTPEMLAEECALAEELSGYGRKQRPVDRK